MINNASSGRTSVSGELKTWHKVSIDFMAPKNFKETASTFRDYRLDVTFTNQSTGQVITVPGFFAADGDAANTSATEGNIWRVNFNPPSVGDWTYEASFRTGKDIAASTNPNAGAAVNFIDGEGGVLNIAPTDKTGEDFRAKGMILQGEGSHYLQHQGDGDYFIRGGPGVPENFLANKDIDNTQKGRHDYSTHAGDYKPGSPEWGNGKGHNLIGAIDYLAEQGQNTIYLLTNTAAGDGLDVWPWASQSFGDVKKNSANINQTANNTNGLTVDDFSTYDVSKLAQWEIIFDHMDEQGIYKNLLFQETENDQLLNGGAPIPGSSLSAERLIYMREMIARFGHANGIQWNMGEENTNTDQERKDMAEYIKAVDPYDHLTVIHTFPNEIDKVYKPLLGVEAFDGTSFQIDGGNVRETMRSYLEASAKAGDPWVVGWDEDSSNRGIFQPYGNNPDAKNEADQRKALWGTLTVGGSGVNWYIKQQPGNAHSYDQNIDTFDAFESVWKWTAAATEFYNTYIPFWEMSEADTLTPNGNDYVMAKAGEYYVAYLPYGNATNVQLNLNGQGGETFDVFWYNPREGGNLISAGQVDGGSVKQIGGPPQQASKDWVLFARNSELSGQPLNPGPSPIPTPGPIPTPSPVPTPTPGNGSKVYLAEQGQVVIEAENTKLQGDWKPVTVGGKQSVVWDANQNSYSQASKGQTLSYSFETDEAGQYRIAMHSARLKSAMSASDSVRGDTGNDVFVSVVNEQTGEVVQKPTKLFTNLGSSDGELRWGTTFDTNHQKSPAQVGLEANNRYRLEVSGRSDGFVLDRITLSNDGFLKNAAIAESTTKGNTPAPTPQPNPNPTPAPNRTITIEAEAMQLSGEYRVESNGVASGGKDISLRGGLTEGQGTAGFTFNGPAGNYNIKISYFDENDGVGRFNLKQGNQQIAGVTLNQKLGSPLANAQTLTSTEVQGIAVNAGDRFTLTGFEDGTATTAEHVRIDKIEFSPVAETIRINAGGGAFTDGNGNQWSADQFFRGGNLYTIGADIASTQDDELFQTERFGKDLAYAIPVENGRYQVNLRFDENYFNGANQRVFDVAAENQLAIDNLDIYAEAGGKGMILEKTLQVDVQDGMLNLDFNSSVNNAKVSGIEILPVN